MKKLLNIIVFLSISTALFAQNVDFKSIHQMQLEYYNNLGSTTQAQFDSLNDFKLMPKLKDKSNCTLNKIVFGWHTYWTGSAYDNYDWSSLSDLCYFSYEFDVNTGDPTDTHSWSTVDVVTEAQNNGTRVHLCVTLFSDHATFLTNSSAEQTLITNLISAVQQRNANGINIDFEGVPSAQSANFTDFMIDLCNQFHTQIPGSIVSIALPAVNWNSTFDVNAMNDYVDLFIIMAYNYYYSGSSNAGPVSPKNHGNFWSQYDASRSVVYYLNQGVSRSKLCLGIPYYGFDWPTTDNTVNSSTTGSGSAKSYKIAVQNAQTYGRLWDNPSSTPYYMYESGGWHQTWYDDDESLGMKYDAINIQDIAGIGIWALGYDDGYTQLWDIIEQKFTNCAPTVDCYGTTTDMGGPGNYYNNEDWTYTIAPQNAYSVSLTFNNFDVELNYDTLFVYDGTYITSPLIGTYTGTTNPGTLVANSGAITLRFQSDGATTALGWVAGHV
jgi:spore germination protein YaaH